MGRTGLRTSVCTAISLLTLWSGQVMAAEVGLCDFVTKIAASRASGFKPYRGAQKVRGDSKMELIYAGTLVPEGSLFCEMSVRTTKGKSLLGASYYACGVGTASQQFQTFSLADALYDKTIADLRACFPTASYSETKSGEPNLTTESFTWIMDVAMPGYSVHVQMENTMGMMNFAVKNLPVTPTSPLVAVSLIVSSE